MFQPFPKKRMPVQEGGCKIKMRNTAHGKEISFSGNCTREQISIAKENLEINDSQEDDD